ncbi:hypothetical protein ACFWNC_06645 [Streptomyces sp. NPDC058369]|uniref:hypothetical protein n=1 Tax=Streptomyces sp. NPDC058369 TaxID=3346462 RepID=UPI00364FFC73
MLPSSVLVRNWSTPEVVTVAVVSPEPFCSTSGLLPSVRNLSVAPAMVFAERMPRAS